MTGTNTPLGNMAITAEVIEGMQKDLNKLQADALSAALAETGLVPVEVSGFMVYLGDVPLPCNSVSAPHVLRLQGPAAKFPPGVPGMCLLDWFRSLRLLVEAQARVHAVLFTEWLAANRHLISGAFNLRLEYICSGFYLYLEQIGLPGTDVPRCECPEHQALPPPPVSQ